MNKKEISKYIRKLRIKSGITQLELSRRAGITPAAINFIENGRRCPNLESLSKICRALKVSADSVLNKGL